MPPGYPAWCTKIDACQTAAVLTSYSLPVLESAICNLHLLDPKSCSLEAEVFLLRHLQF